MQTAIDFLNSVPLASLMLVVTLGFLLGRLRWRGVSLGPAGGTILVAICLGVLGLSFSELYGSVDPRLTLGSFGFALFVYSVGFEAGPRLFGNLHGGLGWRFAAIGVAANLFALGFAWLAAQLLALGGPATAGLLAGALTSAPAYAAAIEICEDPATLALAFALTYPVGLLGTVWVTQSLPRWMGDDLALGAEEGEEEEEPRGHRGRELTRVFEARQPEAIGASLGELDLGRRTGCYVTRLHRGARFFVPEAGTRIEDRDHLMVRGELEALRRVESLIGPEVFDEELRSRMPSPRAVHVSARGALGVRLADLDLVRRRHCLVTEVIRGGVSIEPGPDLVLARDDVLLVSGQRDDVRAVARELGRFERSSHDTDLGIYAGGIFLGLLLGNLTIPGLGLAIGSAPGLLALGALLGRYRRVGSLSAHVPTAARRLVRDLGILLFVAETGVRAGGSRPEGLEGHLLAVLPAALAVTVLTAATVVFLGRRALRLTPLDAWGGTVGGMTSSAGLAVLRQAADSNAPATSYAAAYAVGTVVATLVGRLVLSLG